VNFTGSDQGPALASLECKIDFVEWAPCVSPFTYSNLNEGNHTVQIRAKDAAGNVSAPAVLNFLIDLTNPAITASTNWPAGQNYSCAYGNESFSVSFSAIDAGGSLMKGFTCKLDNGAEEACSGSKAYTISTIDNATHTITVKAVDNAGNTATFTRSVIVSYSDCSYNGGGG
jgi:hypothetical protein